MVPAAKGISCTMLSHAENSALKGRWAATYYYYHYIQKISQETLYKKLTIIFLLLLELVVHGKLLTGALSRKPPEARLVLSFCQENLPVFLYKHSGIVSIDQYITSNNNNNST